MKKILSILKPILISYLIQAISMIIFIVIYLIKNNYQYNLDNELYNYLIIGVTLGVIPIGIILFKNNYRKEENISIFKLFLMIIIGIGISLFYNMLTIDMNTNNKVLMDLNIFILIIYTGIIGPIFEEILFRYVTLNKSISYYNKKISIILVSFIFAMLHTGIINIIYAFILGLLLGYIYIKNRNIIYPIVIHISANITSLFLYSFNIYLLLISIILLISSIFLLEKQKH